MRSHYRDFHFEKTYEAPDTSGFLQDASRSASNAIASVFNSIHARNEQQKQMADEYNYTLSKGTSENDNIYFEEGTKAVTGLMKEGIRSGDKNKIREAQELAGTLESQNNQRRLQDERFKNGEKIISEREKSDKFYNGDVDRQAWGNAYFGSDHDSNHLTRGPRLDEEAKYIGGKRPESFKIDGSDGYQVNYIKSFAEKEKERKGMAGKVDTQYDKSPFWLSNSKPGVSDQHAYEYLNSDPEGRVAMYVENEVLRDIKGDIKAIKARGGDAMKPFAGMDDTEMIEYLKTPGNEKDNPINKVPFGKRVLDRAKQRLTDGANVVSKVDYGNANQPKKPWSNDHFAAWNKTVDMAHSVNEGGEVKTKTGTYFGSAIRKDDGKTIVLKTRNPVRINMQTGKVERGNVGVTDFNVDNAVQMATKKGGGGFQLQGNDLDSRLEYIKSIPLEHFDPDGKVGLSPTLSMAFTGYTINKAGVIGDKIKSKQLAISKQMAAAEGSGDDDKVAKLKRQLGALQDLTEKFTAVDPNDPEYDPDELEIAANSQGITIKDEYLMPADRSDAADIRGISGGYDINDPKFHSEEMKAEQAAWKARAAEAAKSNYNRQASTEKDTAPTKKVVVIGPDGKRYNLPESQVEDAIAQGYKLAP